MRYLRAFTWSFLGCLLLLTVALGQDYQQALAIGCVLVWAVAEIRCLRSERDFYRLHRDELVDTLAWVQRNRGQS